MIFCETHDLVWEIISVSEENENCIVKIIDNVFEKNDEGGLFPLNKSWARYSCVCARAHPFSISRGRLGTFC